MLGSIWVPPFEPRYTLPASTPIILPCIIPHITPNLRNGTRAVGSRPLLGASPPMDVEGLGFGGFHKSEVPFGGWLTIVTTKVVWNLHVGPLL